MTDPSGTTSYQYDNRGNLWKLTNPVNEVTEWLYDPAGRLSQRKLGNGTWEEVSYDSRSRVTGIALKKPGATLRQHTYGYNAVSNVTSHTVGIVTTTYGYDLANQLISESRLGYVASYTYDANGNRATRAVNGQTETYVNDAADKLMSISVGGNTVRSFTYDGRGRRKTDTYAGSTTTYSWDAESRLTSLARPGVTTSSFGYNGLDARVSKTDSTGTFSFKRNGAGVTDPVLSDGAATYTPGISERRAGSSKFLHSGMKNADAQSGASANVDSSRTYDAFGNLTGSVGTWSGPFGYAGGFGYQEDPDHGLRLLGHRYYDSSTGRFISKDPIGDGRNWTVYCEGNPVLAVDPSGLVIQWLLKRFLELGIDLLIELVFEEIESRLGRNGSTVHKELGDITKRAAKQLGLEDWVHVEQPYLRGKPTPNRIRPLGCVIPDVALGPKDKPFATIDWKTGKRGMTRRQREGVVTHVFTTRPGLIMEVGRKGLKKHIVYGRMHLPL